eukprot:1713054-Prymnesium_polylepis.1
MERERLEVEREALQVEGCKELTSEALAEENHVRRPSKLVVAAMRQRHESVFTQCVGILDDQHRDNTWQPVQRPGLIFGEGEVVWRSFPLHVYVDAHLVGACDLLDVCDPTHKGGRLQVDRRLVRYGGRSFWGRHLDVRSCWGQRLLGANGSHHLVSAACVATAVTATSEIKRDQSGGFRGDLKSLSVRGPGGARTQ